MPPILHNSDISPTRQTVRRVTLGPDHQPRGRVHYFVGGSPISRPALLEINKPTLGDACHIIYVDANDYEVAESWHPTVGAAVLHAKWEFGVEPEEWEVLNMSRDR
ncbi:MAG: hypothetical protein ACRDK5_02335 [Solirubrobacterales bacterium]